MEGLEHRDTVTDFNLPQGTFFDTGMVHVLTTATLDRLHEFYCAPQKLPVSLLKIRSERKLEHARAGESFDCNQAEAAATETAHGFHPNQKEQSSIKKGVLDVAPVGETGHIR